MLTGTVQLVWQNFLFCGNTWSCSVFKYRKIDFERYEIIIFYEYISCIFTHGHAHTISFLHTLYSGFYYIFNGSFMMFYGFSVERQKSQHYLIIYNTNCNLGLYHVINYFIFLCGHTLGINFKAMISGWIKNTVVGPILTGTNYLEHSICCLTLKNEYYR